MFGIGLSIVRWLALFLHLLFNFLLLIFLSNISALFWFRLRGLSNFNLTWKALYIELSFLYAYGEVWRSQDILIRDNVYRWIAVSMANAALPIGTLHYIHFWSMPSNKRRLHAIANTTKRHAFRLICRVLSVGRGHKTFLPNAKQEKESNGKSIPFYS